MPKRRFVLALAALGAVPLLAPLQAAVVAEACPPDASAANSALLDRYVAAVNANDTSQFPAIFTENYIQHSGRSPSGLAAQVANSNNNHKTWPDLQLHVEDRMFAGDKIIARNLFTATHTQPALGFAPTGKRVSFRTIDIWRVENGKLAEHWDIVDFAGLEKQLRGG
jgi:predicted ester cyclase